MSEDVEVTEEESAETYVKAGTNYAGPNDEKLRVETGVTFDPGSDLTAACEAYGEEAVFQRYLRGVTKDLGNAIRSSLNKHVNKAIEAGEEVDADAVAKTVSDELASWRPDVSRRPARKDKTDDLLANFGDLSPEKQAELIAKLQAKAAGATAEA